MGEMTTVDMLRKHCFAARAPWQMPSLSDLWYAYLLCSKGTTHPWMQEEEQVAV